MGKHDQEKSLGYFLDEAKEVKEEASWIKRNIKTIALVCIIPVMGFGAFYLTKFFMNTQNQKNNTTPAYSLATNITSTTKEKEKETIGGYEVLGEIKISNIGVNVKVLNPVIDKTSYVEDCLKNGAVLYYGTKLNGLGNTCILGHNTSNVFFGLKNIKKDDVITVTDNSGSNVKYSVIEINEIEPDDFTSFLPMEKNSKEITLVTCNSDGTKRIAVKAIAK